MFKELKEDVEKGEKKKYVQNKNINKETENLERNQ